MTSNEVNPAKGCAGWLKGLFAGVFALIAAGSGLVAILQYINPPVPQPASSNPIVVAVVTSESVSNVSDVSNPPTPAGITSEQWQAIEEFLHGAVAAEIMAYQYGDPSYASMFYGDALQSLQDQIIDFNAKGIMLAAYFDSDKSYIHDIRVTPSNRIEVDSCEYWANEYYDRQSGVLLESMSWMLVPQTIMIEYFNSDFYITSVAFYGDQAFCS